MVERIDRKMWELASMGDAASHKPLRGKWKGYFKVRIDPYRILYRLDRDAHSLIVELIDNRDDIYDSR